MAKIIILLAVIGLAVIVSGCTGGQDVTPIVKTLPEVQQFLKEHPNAKITVTYWSKEDVAKFEGEISQQCDKPITPVAMYKATISEGDLKSIAWIDASTQTLICSTTEGKGGTPVPTSTQTATSTPAPTVTFTPIQTFTVVPTPTSLPSSDELLGGYKLWLGSTDWESIQVKRIILQLKRDGIIVGEQKLAVGNDLNLYDGGTLIVKAKFDAFLITTITPTLSQYTIKLTDLVQYDKVTGNVIFTKDTFVLIFPFPVAVATPAPTSTPTPTPTATSTVYPPPTPASTSTPSPTSTPTPITTTPTPTPTSTFTVPVRTLTTGETWHIGDLTGSNFARGYELTVLNVNAKTNPKEVWVAFGRDGVRLNDMVLTEGYAYTYTNIFSTKIASIYTSGTVDYVRLENSSIAI